MGSGSSKRRWKIAALVVPLLIGVTGLGLYLSVTQPDRAIARLQDELRQLGLPIADEGRSQSSPDTLVELGKQLQNTDRIPWRDKNPAQRAQHLKDTEQIYGKIKTVDFDAAQGDDDLAAPMYLTRAMQHCLHRTTFYLDSDPRKSLEALETMRRLAEELARRGHPIALPSYNLAYTTAVSQWLNQPAQLERVLALPLPDVDPLKVIGSVVDEITLACRSERFQWSWSPAELWENMDNHRGNKYLEREFLEQVLAIVKSAKSKSVLDLAASASVPRLTVNRHALVDKFLAAFIYSVSVDLGLLATVEMGHQQSQAFIEMRRTDPKADVLPKREPFIDPFSGEPFLLHREGDVLWIMSVGPNGRPDMGKEDDIVAKFKVLP